MYVVHKKWNISHENENVWIARSFVNSSCTSRNATRFPTAIRIYFAVYLPSAIRYHLESTAVTIKSVLVQYFAPCSCENIPINLHETILTWLRKICLSRTSRKYLLCSNILSPLHESSATLTRIKFSSDVLLYFSMEIYNFTP